MEFGASIAIVVIRWWCIYLDSEKRSLTGVRVGYKIKSACEKQADFIFIS